MKYRLGSGISTPLMAGLIIAGVTAIVGVLMTDRARLDRLEYSQREKVDAAKTDPSRDAIAVKPAEIISIIEEEQRTQVKESWGELASQCFTDDDLKRFVSNKTAEAIVERLKRTPRFLNVVMSIRHLTTAERAELLFSAEKPLRPTWAQLGRITREGQTEAGQNTEKIIASSIIRIVREMIQLPEDQMQSLYQ